MMENQRENFDAGKLPESFFSGIDYDLKVDNIDNIIECIKKYPKLRVEERLRVLTHFTNFPECYYFVTGTLHNKFEQDYEIIAALEEKEVQVDVDSTYPKAKTPYPIVDFNNPDECFGPKDKIVFDLSENKYFKFGHGYLSNQEVMLMPDALILSDMLDETMRIEEDHAPIQNDGPDDDYRPQSPDYICVAPNCVHEDVRTCSVAYLINVDEAVNIESTTYQAEVPEKEKAPTNFIRFGRYDSKEKLNAKQLSCRKRAMKTRCDNRQQSLYEKRNLSTIAMLQDDIPPDEQMDCDEQLLVKTPLNLDEVQCVRYTYQEKVLIVSEHAQMRTHVEGSVFKFRGLYYNGMSDPNLLKTFVSKAKIDKSSIEEFFKGYHEQLI